MKNNVIMLDTKKIYGIIYESIHHSIGYTMKNETIEQAFSTTFENCLRINGFNPSEKEIEFLKNGFYSLFKMVKGEPKLRKTAESFQGFVRYDDTIVEESLEQSKRACFQQLFHYHLGSYGNGIGKMFSIMTRFECICDHSFAPHNPKDCRYYFFETGTQEYETAKQKLNDNRKMSKQVFDNADTFVTMFLKLSGRTSIPGQAWQAVLK